MEGTVFQSTGDLATDWAAVWASLVRGDDSPELLEAALAVIRSGLSSDRLSDLAALAGRSASPAHRFLLVEGLHGSKDLEQAETELRSGWRDRKQRGALRELALRFLPRAQERFRFYDCHRMVGFRGRHVLEIGGQLPAFFVEAAEPASWTAVDLQPDDDVADRVFYRVVEGDAADLPLPDESFSVVFSSSAFEHIANLGEALYEMHRVLKPNGVVYSDFSPIWSSEEGHHLRGAARRALRDHGLWPLPPWAHLTSSRKEMRRHLAQKLDGKQIRTVERWLYRRKSLNRLFYEDYVHLFHSSPLEVVRLDRRRGKSPDAKTLKRLERRQPGRSSFEVRGMRVLLRRNPPRQARAVTEPLRGEEEEKIRNAIREHLGEEPVSVAKFVHHSGRGVYLARLGQRDMVLKVLELHNVRAVSCQFAVESLNRGGVPTPSILGVELDEHRLGAPFLIQEKADGVPFDRWIQIAKPARKQIALAMTELGSQLRSVHAIETPAGFGKIDDEGRGAFPSWQDYVRRHRIMFADGRKNRILDLEFLTRTQFLGAAELDRLRGIFDSNIERLVLDRPRLLHNDLTLKNVFIDPRRLKVTALIDLHGALAGDPPLEFARFHYFYRGRGYLSWLMKGYGETDPEFTFRQRLYFIWILLEKLAWLDDERRMKRFRSRLEADLESLRHALAHFPA